MSDQKDEQQGVVWAVLIGAVLLAISLAVGVGLYRSGPAVAATAPQSDRPASEGLTTGGASSPASTAAPGADAAAVRVAGDVVIFYFASGKAELAAGAPDALGQVVKGVAAGRKAVISGYHDTTGDPVLNAELAKQRALAVQAALVTLGIGEDKTELRKPEVSAVAGASAEARRVEVTLE